MGAFSRGTARGMAPKARIAMYSVCDSGVCPEADIIAAVDAAVKDGVDILSMSLGPKVQPPLPFHSDSIAIATFGAVRAGVFVALAGGNDGPKESTVENVAPWMTTVGAASVDRLFPGNLHLGDGTVLQGQSLYAMKATRMSPLVYSPCDDDNKKYLLRHKMNGKIALCDNGTASDSGVNEIKQAGAYGVIYLDRRSKSSDGVQVFNPPLPSLTLSFTGAEKLRAYMASSPYPVASFTFTGHPIIGERRAPMVTGFSSRGPNAVVPELLKPDVISPGLNILAAWTGSGNDIDIPLYKKNHNYRFLSGTSMATPHVAGIAALIKKKHPSWTPAMIRSALMTIARTLDNMERDILDDGFRVATPFAAGAGHVHPQLAMDPGLVYDAGARDYVDFLCSLDYTMKQLQLFAPDMATCTRTSSLPGGPADLNYPSFIVIFNGRTNTRTLTRTVTKVSEEAETYKVAVMAPVQVKVTMTPMTLEFNKQNEKKSYTVKFRSLAGGTVTSGWDFGHISWENKDHVVRSPVAFQWKN